MRSNYATDEITLTNGETIMVRPHNPGSSLAYGRVEPRARCLEIHWSNGQETIIPWANVVRWDRRSRG